MSLDDLRIYTVTAPRHTWRWLISEAPDTDGIRDIKLQVDLGVPYHGEGAQIKALEDEVKKLLEQNELLRTQLADAVATCGDGRTDQIGRSRVKSPQIDVRRIARWRDALILTDR